MDKKPFCPKCGQSDQVVKIDDQRTVFQLFIAKLVDKFHCMRCNKSFTPAEGD